MLHLLRPIILVCVVLVPSTIRASDAPGCDGLTEFRATLFPIGERWANGLRDLGMTGPDWSPLTLSSDDWLTYADLSLSVHRDLKSVEAPPWVEEWLDVRVDMTALQEQIGKAAAGQGFLVVLGFEDVLQSIDQRDIETTADAVGVCPDFAQFAYDWDALDGEVDATPVTAPPR